MDNKIEHFLNELNKIKETHPNIHGVWKDYLDKKITTLEKTIEDGFKMLEYTKDVNDFTKEEIISIYCIKNHYNN